MKNINYIWYVVFLNYVIINQYFLFILHKLYISYVCITKKNYLNIKTSNFLSIKLQRKKKINDIKNIVIIFLTLEKKNCTRMNSTSNWQFVHEFVCHINRHIICSTYSSDIFKLFKTVFHFNFLLNLLKNCEYFILVNYIHRRASDIFKKYIYKIFNCEKCDLGNEAPHLKRVFLLFF